MSSAFNRELKMETFSGRRQLQPDVTSGFVQYCACLCSPHCRRAPVGDVKLVCLALWREREYQLSFQSGLLCLETRILQIIVLKLSLFSLSHISRSISNLLSKLTSLNVSMFHVTGSRSNLANSQPKVSFIWTKLSYEPNKNIQTKNMNSDILILCC